MKLHITNQGGQKVEAPKKTPAKKPAVAKGGDLRNGKKGR